MEIFMGTGVSRGENFVPDEVARAVVADKKLKKGDTISKREIVDYLASKQLSPTMATDVAIVLRNMFAVTPTFDEGKDMSTELINELTAIMEGRETFVTDPDPKEMTEALLKKSLDEAVQALFNESNDVYDELVAAQLSLMPFHMVEELAFLNEVFTEEDLRSIDECLDVGGRILAESWVKAMVRPHTISFLPEGVVHEIAEAIGVAGGAHELRRMGKDAAGKNLPLKIGNYKSPEQTAADIRAHSPANKLSPEAQQKRAARAASRDSGADPLMQKQQAAAAAKAHAMHRDQDYKGPMVGLSRKDILKRTNDIAGNPAKPMGLPADKGPSLAARVVGAAKQGMKAVGNIAQAAKDKAVSWRAPQPASEPAHNTAMQKAEPASEPESEPTGEPAKKPGLFTRLVRGAGKLAYHTARGVLGAGRLAAKTALGAGKLGLAAASGVRHGAMAAASGAKIGVGHVTHAAGNLAKSSVGAVKDAAHSVGQEFRAGYQGAKDAHQQKQPGARRPRLPGMTQLATGKQTAKPRGLNTPDPGSFSPQGKRSNRSGFGTENA